MKNFFLIFLFLFSFSLSGCAFFGDRPEASEDSIFDDPEAEEGEDDEEEMDDTGGEEDYEGEEDEEEDYDDEGDGEEDYGEEDEDDEGDDEDEGGGGVFGFFKGLFGGGDDDEGDDEEFGGEEPGGEDDFDDGEEGGESYAMPEESEDSGSAGPSPQLDPAAPAARRMISVKKIKTAPYRRGNQLVNGVYIARSGDTVESVSQKIYGSDNSEALFAINPHFRSRGLKVGDKVYYSSPSRPSDSSQLLIFYQEKGVAPSSHVISGGQNIRSVASKLLGHPDSWKEIWATNPDIQSKGLVQRDISLQYWPDGAAAAAPSEEAEEPVQAEAPESLEGAPEDEPPQPPDSAASPEDGISPPPLDGEAGSPPDDEGGAPEGSPGDSPGDSLGDSPEDPPFAEDQSPQPPGESPAPSEQTEKTVVQSILEQKKLLAGSLAVLAVLVLMLRVIIRKRRRDGEFDYTSTNIKA